MEKSKIIEECLEYFTSNMILKRILDSCINKYKSFGTSCGTIVLRNLTHDEIEIIEGFTGRNYHGKKSLSLSISTIQKSIDKSKFRGITIDELLDFYCGGNLRSKKQEEDEEVSAITMFYDKLKMEYFDTKAGKWINQVINKNDNVCKMLHKKYRDKVLVNVEIINELEHKLWNDMKLLMNTINQLPVFRKKYEYLPSFSARITGDPHYYDEGKEYTIFLYYAIQEVLKSNQNVSSSISAEKKHQILFEAGLIRDNISNNVMVFGIKAWNEQGEHQGISGFCIQNEPLSITISTIISLKQVKCIDDYIYVVENPTVFAQIIKDKKRSALCVNGHPNLAVLLLLDIIAQNKTKILYNGDFDPEGLMIAQKLKNRYNENLLFWNYEITDYMNSISDKDISKKRLKILDALTSQELIKIGELLRIHKKAGYQEKLFLDDNSLKLSNRRE